MNLLHSSLTCKMHFLFYLHALSLTSLPNQIYCSEDILEWFLILGFYSLSVYLSIKMKPFCKKVWKFISVLYIRNLSGQCFTRNKLYASPSQWSRLYMVLITLLYFLPLQNWQGFFYEQALLFHPKYWRVYQDI